MTASATFGAASFKVKQDGIGRITEAETTEMHIPGSNITVIDHGGLLPERLTYELVFADDAAYDTMRGLVGTSGTLTTWDIGGVTAYLKSLKRSLENQGGSAVVLATAEFVI